MGCRSDYMEQNATEKFVQTTAQNLVYVFQSLKKPVPKLVSEKAHDYYATDTNNKLTPMLCDLIKNMTKSQQNKIVFDGRKAEARKLADWWDKHQEADKRRNKKNK